MTFLILLWVVVSLVASLAASLIVPREQAGRNGSTAWILFFLLSVFLPFFGAILALAYATALRSVRGRIHTASAEPIIVPLPARDFRLRASSVTPGAIAGRLRGARNPSQRVEALSQIVSARFAEPTRLLRSALRDKAEEVRLLAYAALDQREQENTELLLQLQEDIKDCSNPRMQRRLQDYLAWLRWNIEHAVSRELAEPETRREVAPLGAELAEDKATALPAMLAGLAALEAGQADLAMTFLQQAERDRVAPAVLAPHYAAALYLQRDLDGLRKLYAQHPELALSSRYGPSYRYWSGSAA